MYALCNAVAVGVPLSMIYHLLLKKFKSMAHYQWTQHASAMFEVYNQLPAAAATVLLLHEACAILLLHCTAVQLTM
jgi:hypothetical protein